MVSISTVVSRIDSAAIKLDVEKYMREAVEVKAAVIARAKEVEEYWKGIAPVSDRGPHPLRKGGLYIENPGDYRKSIRTKYVTGATGFSAKVGTKSPIAHWLEYGSVHNPEHGYAAKTVEQFGGEDYTVRTG